MTNQKPQCFICKRKIRDGQSMHYNTKTDEVSHSNCLRNRG